jgi:hypothetical protein
MDVGAQPHVIGEIPADVIRVFIDYDLIRVPVPVIAVTNVVGSHTKIETAEPKPAWSASRKMPYMAFAKATGKATVLPRMTEMVVWVIAPRVVSNPLISSCVNVGRLRVTRLIRKPARRRMLSFRGKLMLSFLHWWPRSGWMC